MFPLNHHHNHIDLLSSFSLPPIAAALAIRVGADIPRCQAKQTAEREVGYRGLAKLSCPTCTYVRGNPTSTGSLLLFETQQIVSQKWYLPRSTENRFWANPAKPKSRKCQLTMQRARPESHPGAAAADLELLSPFPRPGQRQEAAACTGYHHKRGCCLLCTSRGNGGKSNSENIVIVGRASRTLNVWKVQK
eukprot:1155880-Pelagomonas_calceolata.AAC.1